MAVVIGVLLVALGAVGATVTQRWLEDRGRARVAPLFLAPHGVLIGAGAAIARSWDLVPAMLAGAVLIPVVGALGRMWEVRRAARRSRSPHHRGRPGPNEPAGGSR